MLVKCTYCGEVTEKKPSIVAKSATGRFYCCKDCQHADRRGNILWNYKGGGIEIKCDQCGNAFKQDRHKYSKNKNNFCSVECRNEFRADPDRDLRKKIRDSRKYKKWRYDVFDRDNYTCQECGRTEHLDAHHIIDFWNTLVNNNISTFEEAMECDEIWNLDNGQTLCVYCHSEKHPINKNLILKRIAC